MSKPKVIAIVGPTASGKTSLGIYLAKHIGGEVISADSRQVYRELDIGTGKVLKDEMEGIPHHLLDVVDPKKQFSASDYAKKANEACFSILQKTKIPLVVGGTGFYVDTLLGRMVIPEVPPNKELRTRLEHETLGTLLTQLEEKDPARAATIERTNKRRIIRALEIIEALGTTPPGGPDLEAQGAYEVLWLGINPPTEVLEENIYTRLLQRIEAGMIEEAIHLHKNGLSYERMEELGLEYRFLALLLQGALTKEECILQLNIAIRQYAKRQIRWFKRNKDIHWVTSNTEALELAHAFLAK